MRAAIFLFLSGCAACAEITLTTPATDYTLQSNYWPADQMFAGSNNTAPSQTATDSSSLMTRGLSDTRYEDTYAVETMDIPVSMWAFTSTNGGSAGTAAGFMYGVVSSGTSASGCGVAQAHVFVNKTAANVGVDWGKPFTVIFRASTSAPTLDTNVYFRIYDRSNFGLQIPEATLAHTGFELRLTGTGTPNSLPRAVLSSYSGTTLTVGGTATWTSYSSEPFTIRIVNNGSGTISAAAKVQNSGTWFSLGSVAAPSGRTQCNLIFAAQNSGSNASRVDFTIWTMKIIDKTL